MNFLKKNVFSLIASLTLSVILSTYAFAESPDAVLKKADAIRNPAESFEMKVEVKNSKDNGPDSEFSVSLKGNTRTLIKTTKPISDRGRNLLMIDEEMWAFIPSLKRAVRVSLSQKLTGQAANGDISRMRWAGDYTSKVEKEDEKTWILFLTANKKGLTYEKIRVWIEKGNYRPQYAEYLSLEGKPLKKSWFKNYKAMAGETRPSQIIIQDALRPELQSTLEIKSMEIKNFPNSLFDQRNL